tara:strand:- start:4137 stop:4766 length:630 start_codon:yes stop_codon:yes gene_type:complete
MQMSDYNQIAQPWAERTNKTILPLLANCQWFFAHHAFAWETVPFESKSGKKTITKYLLLPILQKINLIPGVNNVRDGGDTTLLNGQMQKEGWVSLDANTHNYLKVYPCRNGRYFASRFVKMENLANKVIQTFQHDEYDDWRRDLIAKNDIALPHEHVLRLLQLQIDQKINNLKDTHLPHMQKKQQDLFLQRQQLIDAIENAREVGNYVV